MLKQFNGEDNLFKNCVHMLKKKKSSQLQTYLTSCAKFNSKLIMDKHNKPKAD